MQPGAPPTRDPREEPAPSGLLGHLQAYVTEPTLWPVLLVALTSLSVLLAWALVLAVGDRNLFALGAIALLVILSADAVRGDLRRPTRRGLGTALLVSLWGLAGGIGWVARWYGLL